MGCPNFNNTYNIKRNIYPIRLTINKNHTCFLLDNAEFLGFVVWPRFVAIGYRFGRRCMSHFWFGQCWKVNSDPRTGLVPRTSDWLRSADNQYSVTAGNWPVYSNPSILFF
jgi:hypothetical protein